MTQQHPKTISFWLLRNTKTNDLFAQFGQETHLTGNDVLVYTEYQDGTGYFQEGYSPNTICVEPYLLPEPNFPLPYRVGSAIFNARIEKVKLEKRCADPEAEPDANVCVVDRSIQEVDEPEFTIKGDLWAFIAEQGLWSNINGGTDA